MKNVNAQQVVYDLINSGHDLHQVRDAFCDGNTLAILGYTDEDTELVTDVYHFACELIESEEQQAVA